MRFFCNVQFAHGADLRAQNDEHETALHVAAREGREEVLRYLLQRGTVYDCNKIEGKITDC